MNNKHDLVMAICKTCGTDHSASNGKCTGLFMKPKWTGEGLPPIGCECEVQYWNDGTPEKVKIIAYHGDEAWVEFVESKGKTSLIGNPEFRPIRTEAERRREEAINKIQSHTHVNFVAPISTGQAIALYEAIAAGKIPGVKLEDA